MKRFEFEQQVAARASSDYVTFEDRGDRIEVSRSASDMEDVHELRPEQYAEFVELIGQPPTSDVLEAVQRAVEVGSGLVVVKAFERLGKVTFSEIDFDAISWRPEDQ